MKKMLVIGGCSIDYIATSDEPLEECVSNNGTLSESFGGVSQNVCTNLARLGNKVNFITVIGKDSRGESIQNHLLDLGVIPHFAPTTYPTCTYIAINNSNHDMALAIFDNRIVSEISVDYIKSQHELISTFDYIIMDANLSQETIEYIVNTYYKTKKIFCESIAPQLVVKYKNVLDKIFFIKCNIFEARALVDNKPLEKEELIKELFNKGLTNVLVSNNKYDIYYGLNNKDIFCYPVIPHTNFKNTTGCGDALFSGVIDCLSLGKTFKEAVGFGLKLSSLTIMSESATSEEVVMYSHGK